MPVVVVGSVNADLIVPVASLPGRGVTILATGDPVRAGGGKGANVAVAAARDGAEVRLVAALGDDDAGRAMRADLEGEGVGTAGVVTLPGRPSGLALICIEPEGENFIVVAPGANGALGADEVARGLEDLAAGDVAVVNFEIPREAVAATVRTVAARGARIVINPSPVRPVDGLLSGRTTLVVNAGELAELTGEDDVARGAAALRRAGAGAVVVTRGAQGVHVLAQDGRRGDIPAYPAKPTDTTGAGDTFTGVLAAALARGEELLGAAHRGAAAAALATQRVGARAAMPGPADTDRLLAAGARRPGVRGD